jgi:C4-dicarboxylate transporter DctM subunit
MTHSTTVAIAFAVLFVLMLLRVPIGIAMAMVGVGGYSAIAGISPGLNLLMSSPISTASDYTLSVIPMFILMGVFASAGGMSRELFDTCRSWVGHRRGGMAVSAILACGGFSAINGSSIAATATMASTALPEMRRLGYPASTSAGLIAASGTLGVIIPPSVVLILYGLLTQQDIGRLFMAGILPGVLGIGLYIITVQFLIWRSPDQYPRLERHGWAQRIASLKQVWPTLLLLLLVLGSILGGWATLTEAAGVGAVGAAFIGLVRKRLDWPGVMQCLVEALRTTSSIFIIAIGAYLFGYFLTVSQTTQALVKFVSELPIGRYEILALILLVYVILGALMDELAILLLTVPIVYPVIVALQFDPVWFGMVLTMVITLGLILPPVGMNVFVVNSIVRDLSLVQIYRGVAPFIVTDLVRLVLIVAFPWLSLVFVQ